MKKELELIALLTLRAVFGALAFAALAITATAYVKIIYNLICWVWLKV